MWGRAPALRRTSASARRTPQPGCRMLTDSHCHLDDAQFNTDRDEVVRRALDAGVTRMVAIGTGTGPPDLEAGVRLAEKYPTFLATVGVHPHDAAKAGDETLRRVDALLQHP